MKQSLRKTGRKYLEMEVIDDERRIYRKKLRGKGKEWKRGGGRGKEE
jgi:hypothetical protein